MSDDVFAPPPFRAADALATLRRTLRDLKLVEREGTFEWRAQPIAQLALENEASIRARIVKRPARSPEWETRLLRSHADLRKLADELKQRIARWSDRDE